jgi:hypothetical protein
MIPDGITPKSAWRAWHLRGNRITSSNQGVTWEPGVAIKAFCPQLGQKENIEVNILDQGRAQAIRNHMAQNFSPPIYEVDEGENRVYFTKKSYLVIPRAVPVALRVPSVQCSCGIYAANSVHEAMNYGEIIGRVAMWGYVITHSGGFRAQYAYPQSFYVADQKVAATKEVLADYGVPVLGLSQIGLAAAPDPDPLGNGVMTVEQFKQMYGAPPTSGYQHSVMVKKAVEVEDDDEEDDPTPGDGVRRLTIGDLRRWVKELVGR